MAKITINDKYLFDQMNLFGTYQDESYERSAAYAWGGTGSVPMDLSADTQMKFGGPNFVPGFNMNKAANAVRGNFSTRMMSFNEQSGFLNVGLKALLDDSENIESLNTVSADDFEYYVDETATATNGGKPTASGSGDT
jgi:hypothetical protein